MRRDSKLAILGRERPLAMIQERKEIADLAMHELIQSWAQNRPLEIPIENIYSAVISYYYVLRPYVKKYMAGYFDALCFLDELMLQSVTKKVSKSSLQGNKEQEVTRPKIYDEVSPLRLKKIYDALDEAWVELDFGAPTPLAWDTVDLDDHAVTDEFFGDANELTTEALS